MTRVFCTRRRHSVDCKWGTSSGASPATGRHVDSCRQENHYSTSVTPSQYTLQIMKSALSMLLVALVGTLPDISLSRYDIFAHSHTIHSPPAFKSYHGRLGVGRGSGLHRRLRSLRAVHLDSRLLLGTRRCKGGDMYAAQRHSDASEFRSRLRACHGGRLPVGHFRRPVR